MKFYNGGVIFHRPAARTEVILNYHGGRIGPKKNWVGTTFAFFIRLSSNFAGW